MSQDFTVIGTSLQKRVNGALAMMQYTVAPDVTTSSLSISSQDGGTNGMFMTQLGGGFTWSKSFRSIWRQRRVQPLRPCVIA